MLYFYSDGFLGGGHKFGKIWENNWKNKRKVVKSVIFLVKEVRDSKEQEIYLVYLKIQYYLMIYSITAALILSV